MTLTTILKSATSALWGLIILWFLVNWKLVEGSSPALVALLTFYMALWQDRIQTDGHTLPVSPGLVAVSYSDWLPNRSEQSCTLVRPLTSVV